MTVDTIVAAHIEVARELNWQIHKLEQALGSDPLPADTALYGAYYALLWATKCASVEPSEKLSQLEDWPHALDAQAAQAL